MKAKYNGFCKITNQKIIAGETEIVKINGVWQAEKSLSRMDLNSQIKAAVFASEMAAPDWSEYYAEMQAEEEAYETKKSEAAQRLNAQFPDVPATNWLRAIEATMDPLGKPVILTSAEKEAAFNKEIKNL